MLGAPHMGRISFSLTKASNANTESYVGLGGC